MTFRYNDRTKQITNANPGTGNFVFASTPTGFLAFSAIPSVANGDTVPYWAYDGGSLWETGYATYNSGQLTRPATVKTNSAGTTSPINFNTGAITVACDAITAGVVLRDSLGNIGACGISSPAAWAQEGAVQFGKWGGIQGMDGLASAVAFRGNTYYNSGDKFLQATGYGLTYQLDAGAGAHIWLSTAAQSGGAGAAATYSERMRIDVGGGLRVGATASVSGGTFDTISASVNGNATLDVCNTSATSPRGMYIQYTSVSSGGGDDFLGCYDINSARFQVKGSGNCQNTNNSYGGISDAKLKQDVVLAASQWEDIKAIGAIVSKYRFKNDPEGPLQIGVIAQDLQKISPGLVGSTPDIDPVTKELTGEETMHVNYSVLYMKGMKALAEALERIETLEKALSAKG